MSGGYPLSGGFGHLGEAELPPLDDVKAELLLHVRWLAESARDQAAGTLEGHGPEQHALNLQAMLRRFENEAKAGTKD